MTPPQKQIELLEALADIEREVIAVLDPDALLRVMVTRAKHLFGGECGMHLLTDGWLVPRIDTDPDVMTHGPRVAVGEGVLGRCAQTRRGALVNDYPTRPEAIAFGVALGLQHVIAEPLLTRDELIGVIMVSRRGKAAPPFSQDDSDALKRFAGLAALALHNARLYEHAERRRHEAEILARLADDLNRSLDLDTVLERVVARARDPCASDFAAVAVRESDDGRPCSGG